jgi:hypothetical protein
MSKLRLSVLVLFSSIILFAGCSADVDIIAPKTDVTIVYGLLELNQSRHYIRINKSFVGEDSASVLAGEPGANEYSDAEMIEASVRELNADGSVRRRFGLQPTYVYNKEAGDFFSDSNKVYYFDGNLDVAYQYELYLKIQPEGEDEKEVTALTDVLGSSDGSALRVNKPNLGGNGEFCEGRDNSEVDWVDRNEIRPSWSLKWSAANNASSYTSYGRFYYVDIYPDGTVKRDSVILPIGVEKVTASSNLGEVEFVISPTEFYSAIGRAVPDYTIGTDEFTRIAVDTIQFFIEVANEELATYVDINKPATNIVQERPSYTNLNNGIGLFASKYISSTRTAQVTCSGRILTASSMEELLYSGASNTNESTGSKGFTNYRCNNGNCL